jgi:hypothetical protein
MSKGPWVLLAFGFLLLLIGVVSLGVGLFGLLLMFFGGLWLYSEAQKCPSCHWPWTLRESSRATIAQQRGFGIVTRVETHSGRVGNTPTEKVVQRQERVPVVISTIRVDYVCSHCGKASNRQFQQQAEDFGPAPSPPAPVVRGYGPVQPVTVNVNQAAAAPSPPQIMRRCHYCNAVYPESRLKCPNCGAGF